VWIAAPPIRIPIIAVPIIVWVKAERKLQFIKYFSSKKADRAFKILADVNIGIANLENSRIWI
jgi:hypothetical protein